jgi:hypothetical protein
MTSCRPARVKNAELAPAAFFKTRCANSDASFAALGCGLLVLRTGGRVLGTHAGLHRFTVGQRKGLGLSTGVPLQVGRSQATPTRLTDPTVSRVHCEVEWDGDLRFRGRAAAVSMVMDSVLTWVDGTGVDASMRECAAISPLVATATRTAEPSGILRMTTAASESRSRTALTTTASNAA